MHLIIQDQSCKLQVSSYIFHHVAKTILMDVQGFLARAKQASICTLLSQNLFGGPLVMDFDKVYKAAIPLPDARVAPYLCWTLKLCTRTCMYIPFLYKFSCFPVNKAGISCSELRWSVSSHLRIVQAFT